jgi:hypothetical protein
MARGKEAIQAANRRETAARQLARGLTDEIADLRVQLKLAHAVNVGLQTEIDRLRVIERQMDDDALLQEALKACAAWKRNADAHKDLQKHAIKEWKETLGQDIRRLFRSTYIGGHADFGEFLFRRYPSIIGLMVGAELRDSLKGRAYAPKEDENARRHMSDDMLRRFQRITGTRETIQWDPGRDAADVAADLLDASSAGFTREEILEYIGIESQP